MVIHAANNAFGDWTEFNKMIGLGAWGGRNSESGPYVYFDKEGKEVRDPGPGICGSHGPEHEYVITTRQSEHPIMRGLPLSWLHAKDELYDRMRGPAENMTVLATAYSDLEKNDPPWDPQTRGSERNEPMLMVTQYGKGRVFIQPLVISIIRRNVWVLSPPCNAGQNGSLLARSHRQSLRFSTFGSHPNSAMVSG